MLDQNWSLDIAGAFNPVERVEVDGRGQPGKFLTDGLAEHPPADPPGQVRDVVNFRLVAQDFEPVDGGTGERERADAVPEPR